MSIASVVAKGSKKRAIAQCICTKSDKHEVIVNNRPFALMQPQMLRSKVMEVFMLLDRKYYENLAFKVSVRGGGDVTRMYAIRQSIAKGLLAFYGKFIDEQVQSELKAVIAKYDRFMLVADSRRKEPKKAGGPGARARYQKSYR
ncbi:small subunit ribosomal protein S16e [Nematocida homosporus]|uniref:small subunit ribosomal protein S16e n=1 Tax=Nematocida homosporus TaxID=1912981 RepID=UPI00221E433A|nr:small subunit ribosomal protein S16e [Nematocida homosporus]KAI5184272.1 small subunit ribosomal protein S16e [Nematocida homosporus]